MQGKVYLSYKTMRMKQHEVLLCDAKYKMPMTYNGIENAKKAAEKYNGEVVNIPMQMNRFYIRQKKTKFYDN